ncbi:hypothetical protein [Elongatibacter sediminis]|uniref:Uncharacterized protein n=1 Tax=Elongatibacter sediminis TaxID=3119006 RepID=A0AAW9REM2_9GAMM
MIGANRFMLMFLLVSPTGLSAQQADVTFFVIGKHASFEQEETGGLQPVDFSFFSEIFLSANGDASDAVLTLPTGARFKYRDLRGVEGGERDNLLLVSGKRRYPSFAELQHDYPDGQYTISFETPGGRVNNASLVFTGNALPEAPRILPRQAGKPVCSVVDPSLPLTVYWSPFVAGTSDSQGILDDLVFVILTDDEGHRVAHSGRPFEGQPYLTYQARSFEIPVGTMEAGRAYRLTVEHAILDDTRFVSDIPAMTTRAVTTGISFKTAANDVDAADCHPANRGEVD